MFQQVLLVIINRQYTGNVPACLILTITVTCIIDPGPFTTTQDRSHLAIVDKLLPSVQLTSVGEVHQKR